MNKKNNSGFTLIELLLVVSIIGLLATFSVVGYRSVAMKKRDTGRVAEINELTKALLLYSTENSRYPVSTDEICLDGSDVVATALADEKLMSRGISDPLNPTEAGKCISYITNADGTEYTIKYYLETSSNAGDKGEHVMYSNY